MWAIASDPITFTAEDAGRLAVVVNANDVAVRGARPRYFVAVGLIAPHEATELRIHELLRQVRATCDAMGVALIGGHTEVTPGLPHSVIVGTMLGEVERRALTSGGLRAGDRVAMTRAAGLEGTAILLAEHRRKLYDLWGASSFDALVPQLGDDWLLVATEALAAAGCDGVTALHDVTEGGVGEALHEMAAASGLRIEAERDAVPVLEATARLSGELGIDPLGLIGSGSLLIGCHPGGVGELEAAMEHLDVPLTWIGHAAHTVGEPSTSLPRFPRDELLKTALMDGIRAVVFDMDGTVVDSRYDWPAIRAALGVEGASIIDELNGLSEPDRSRRWAELESFENQASATATVHGGAHDLLELLAAHNLTTALVTNNTDENTRLLLERFDLRFDVVVTRDSGFYKPSGAPIEEAVRRLGVEPNRCFAVGDSSYDILASRAAGLAGVCIVNDRELAYAKQADLCFRDVQSFVRYLQIVLG
jgi:HAD superfamily hydrolase (TIGR01549 family)